jgi:hypothetical protein
MTRYWSVFFALGGADPGRSHPRELHSTELLYYTRQSLLRNCNNCCLVAGPRRRLPFAVWEH